MNRIVLADWAWAHPTYDFAIENKNGGVKTIVIDPTGLMADIKQDDNVYPTNKK